MTIDVETSTDRVIELDEFKELYRERKYDSSDCDSLAAAGELFRSLSNNKSFLTEFLIEELTSGMACQAGNTYGPQILMLGNINEDAFMRANFWPAVDEEEYYRSPEAFVYDLPHDHNFNFLTVGYWGPGYKSRYYEYDYDAVDGFPGEFPNLIEVETKTLSPDKIMVYRARKDVHCQFPPEKMSITINVMDKTPGYQYYDQYIFNQKSDTIEVVNSSRCSSNMFDIAAIVGDDRAKNLLLDISQYHDSDFAKFHALRAVIKAESRADERTRFLRLGASSPSRAVRGWVDRYIRMHDIAE